MADNIEEKARALHRRTCNRQGIHDEEKIASYWEACRQSTYRARAAYFEWRGGKYPELTPIQRRMLSGGATTDTGSVT